MEIRKQAPRSIFSLIILWSLFVGGIMFLVNFWASDFIGAVGVLLGFFTIIFSERLQTPQNPFARHIFAIASVFLIVGFSFAFLGSSCWAQIISSQFCGNRSRESLLLANFFIAVPIIPIYLFVHIPRLIFQRKF